MKKITEFDSWLNIMTAKISFYEKASLVKRDEYFFPWGQISSNRSIRQIIKNILVHLGFYKSKEKNWFFKNKHELFQARELFEDSLSKMAFDATILLRVVGHNKFFYPFLNNLNYVNPIKSKLFKNKMLPDKYLGTDLMEYECEINNGSVPFPVKIVATENWVNFQNTFSQYFMNFSGNTFIPKEGDVVFDCGSCIGEVSMIYGAMVGLSGRVYMFDPVPMHIKFCEFQSESNPKMREIFKSAQFALDKESNYVDSSVLDDSDVISPGGLNVDSYSSISIDDYIKINGIKKLDYIKMDIEGCECNALEGSRTTIKEFKPKLVISAYHKEDDFWVIPKLIKSLNPTYKLFFAHHSPVSWESVIYATE